MLLMTKYSYEFSFLDLVSIKTQKLISNVTVFLDIL